MGYTPLPPTNARLQRALFLPLTILAWLAVVLVIGWLLGHVVRTIVLVSLAALLAFALSPLVGILGQSVKRPLAVAGAYLVALVVLAGLGTLLVNTSATQVVELVQNAPAYAGKLQGLELRTVVALSRLGVPTIDVNAFNQQVLNEIQQAGGTLATSTVGFLSTLAGDLIDAVLVLILSIYFTLNGPHAARWLRENTPLSVRNQIRFTLDVTEQVIGGYIRGTLTLAALIGLLVGAGMAVLGVPYAALLGVLAFFMEFVPIVGVLISGAVSAALALTVGPGKMLLVLAYFVFVHIIEGDVVGPRIMGNAVGIHPATGIIALLAGIELFGPWGALFAAPIAGLLQAFLTTIWHDLTDRRTPNMLIPEAVTAPVPEPVRQPLRPGQDGGP